MCNTGAPAAILLDVTGLAAAIRRAFHETDTVSYRWLHSVIWTLVGLSVVLVAVDLSISEHHPIRPILAVVDLVVLGIFTVEIVLRVGTYRPATLDFFEHGYVNKARIHITGRLKFLVSPLILIDLVTVLAVVPALRGLRVLRLLRLIKARALFRYSNPLEGTIRAFVENRLLYAAAFSLVGASTVIVGLTIYLVERSHPDPFINSVADGMWWAIVTLTTVGFGDLTPRTALGRVVAGFVMVEGMFVLALFAGIVGNTLLRTVLSIREEQFRMSGYTDHLVICGYHPGARMLLDTVLREPGKAGRQIVIFAPGGRPHDVPSEFTWLEGDPTKESELPKVRLSHAGGVIIVGGRHVSPQAADATTILTVFTLRSFMTRQPETEHRRRPLYVVAEILDAENVQHARAAGADEVIETRRVGFSLLAHAIAQPGTADVMGRLAGPDGQNIYVGRQRATDAPPATFGEAAAALRHHGHLLLVGVRDVNGRDHVNPPDDMPITPACGLVYLAREPVLPPW